MEHRKTTKLGSEKTAPDTEKADAVVLGAFKIPEGFSHHSKASMESLLSGHPILQSYCHKLGNDFVLQASSPTTQLPSGTVLKQPVSPESLHHPTKPVLVEKIEPIKVTAVPMANDEYAICVAENSGLFNTDVGASIIKDFRDSLITGVPVVRKSWMEDFAAAQAEGKSTSDSPLTWNQQHVYANYRFREHVEPLTTPEQLETLDKSFSSRLTTVAVNTGVTKFAVMTSLFDQFIQQALNQSDYVIGSPLILRELDAGPSNGVMDYCVMRSQVAQAAEEHIVATFRAIQASLLHHVPMIELAKHLGQASPRCFDYLIAYLPKGLVDQDEALMENASDYLDRIVSFEGARGGLLLVEFYEEFGFRLALESSQYSLEQVRHLTDQFKQFVLTSLAVR